MRQLLIKGAWLHLAPALICCWGCTAHCLNGVVLTNVGMMGDGSAAMSLDHCEEARHSCSILVKTHSCEWQSTRRDATAIHAELTHEQEQSF